MQPLPNSSWIGLNAYEALPQIHYIASSLGIMLGPEPTELEIQEVLFPKLGKGKVYADNVEQLPLGIEIFRDPELMDVLHSLLMSVPMRSVHGLGRPPAPATLLGVGGTANWMTRRCWEAAGMMRHGLEVAGIYLLAGSRVVDEKSASDNAAYLEFVSEYEQPPMEWQLLSRIMQDYMGRWHNDLVNTSNNLDDNLAELMAKHPELFRGQIYVPINAAALNVPLQIRRGIREIFPEFDANPEAPQFWFSSDGFQIARCAEHLDDPMGYQNPLTLFSYIPRITRELFDLRS